jgi:hypothetical protein
MRHVWQKRHAQRVLAGKLYVKRKFGRTRHGCKDKVQHKSTETDLENGEWINLEGGSRVAGRCEDPSVSKQQQIMTSRTTVSFSTETVLYAVYYYDKGYQ